MDLKQIMQFNNFVVIGNTAEEEKYAYKIKEKLLQNNYTVACVDKEYKSINDVPFEIDVLDLCMNPLKSIKLLKENTKPIKTVVIQPGAESEEIKDFLKSTNIPYIEGCLLVGMSLYKKTN